jgi:hypothetical protein
VAARKRVGVELDERDFGSRALKGELQDEVEQLAAPEHDWEERRLGEMPAPVEQDADDAADRERGRGLPTKVSARKTSVPRVLRSPESQRAKLTSQRASGSFVR